MMCFMLQAARAEAAHAAADHAADDEERLIEAGEYAVSEKAHGAHGVHEAHGNGMELDEQGQGQEQGDGNGEGEEGEMQDEEGVKQTEGDRSGYASAMPLDELPIAAADAAKERDAETVEDLLS